MANNNRTADRSTTSFRGTRVIAFVLSICVLAMLAPRQAAAKWDARSGELPGIASKKSWIIVAAAGAGAAALYLLNRRRGPEKVQLLIEEAQFDDTNVGDAGSGKLKVTNISGTSVTIDGVAVKGKSFSVEGEPPLTIAPGQDVVISVKFAPAKRGQNEGTLRLSAGGTGLKDTRFKISLKASGV